MSDACICGGGLGKLGTPNCVSQEKDFVRAIFSFLLMTLTVIKQSS